MTRPKASSGFALLLVLWTLVTLSAVALALAATASTEIHLTQDSWDDLQAERLAQAGHDFAAFLETRMIGTSTENLTGLPVEHVIAGMRYRIVLARGTIDLLFEGENGKFDLLSADEATTANFLASWTGDFQRAQEVAASIADWSDADDIPRPSGAESEAYSGSGYLPRNNGLGAADLRLIKGVNAQDLGPAVIQSDGVPGVRKGLLRFISVVPSGNTINVNYASPAVLRSVPNMTPDLLASIVQMRQQSIFANAEDFRSRLGLPSDSMLMNRLTFDRGSAPAVLSVARIGKSGHTRSERRIQTQIRRGQSRRDVMNVLAAIERDSSD